MWASTPRSRSWSTTCCALFSSMTPTLPARPRVRAGGSEHAAAPGDRDGLSTPAGAELGQQRLGTEPGRGLPRGGGELVGLGGLAVGPEHGGQAGLGAGDLGDVA